MNTDFGSKARHLGRVLLLAASLAPSAGAIGFGAPVRMTSTTGWNGGAGVWVGEGCPTLVDWDKDGLLDILIGQRSMTDRAAADNTVPADVAIWKNVGTASIPDFCYQGVLSADAIAIKVPSG